MERERLLPFADGTVRSSRKSQVNGPNLPSVSLIGEMSSSQTPRRVSGDLQGIPTIRRWRRASNACDKDQAVVVYPARTRPLQHQHVRKHRHDFLRDASPARASALLWQALEELQKCSRAAGSSPRTARRESANAASSAAANQHALSFALRQYAPRSFSQISALDLPKQARRARSDLVARPQKSIIA